MLVWVLSSMIETQTPWQSLLFEIYNWQLLIFWLSMLTNCYLFYFFQSEFEAVLYIPKKKYKEDSGTPTPISWAEIKNLKAINKINIIKYFTVEAEQTIVNSWQIANKYEDEKVNPIHLFVALINFEQIQIIFSRLGISFTTLKSKISRVLALQLAKLDSQESIYLSDKVKQIIFESYHIAYQLREKNVEVTELL